MDVRGGFIHRTAADFGSGLDAGGDEGAGPWEGGGLASRMTVGNAWQTG